MRGKQRPLKVVTQYHLEVQPLYSLISIITVVSKSSSSRIQATCDYLGRKLKGKTCLQKAPDSVFQFKR